MISSSGRLMAVRMAAAVLLVVCAMPTALPARAAEELRAAIPRVAERAGFKVDAVVQPEPVTWARAREGRILDAAAAEFIRTADYREIYRQWHGEPEPFWTVRSVAVATGVLLLVSVAVAAGWRYRTVVEFGRSMALAQARQARLNAALAALSGCNHALVRAADESQLLSEVCRVVGESLHGVAVTIQLDGQAAPSAEWRAEGGGPVGWGVCLLLIAEDRRLGVLNLDSARDPGMDDEERGLLRRLADDIAFGILALHHREERRRSAQALADSEERYRTLVDNLTDFVWEIDAEGRYTYVSARVADILGYTPEEVVGKSPFDMMPPDEALRVEERFLELAELHRSVDHLENVNVAKDGRMVVLETSGMPILDAEGRLQGYRGVDRDITERKRAEAELLWEADVRGVFAELGRLLMAPISIDQISRTVVERGGRLIGAQLGCACYTDPASGLKACTTPSGLQHAGLCGDCAEGRSVANKPPEGLCTGLPDGAPTVRRLLSVPVTIDGAPAGRLTFADAEHPFEPRDLEVAERLAVIYGLALRRAWDEKALLESRTKLETVTAAAQDGIIMMDAQGCISFWNNAAERIFGWSEGEILGRPYHVLTADVALMGQDGDIFDRTLEVEGVRKDGSGVPIEVTVVATRLGQQSTAVATVKDLTERKEAERLRLEIEKRLFQAQKMDALGTLAGGIAHNFNNMLMPVMVLTELTLNEMPPDSAGRKRLEAVLQASRRARDLIQRILTFGRQDAPAMQPLALREVIAEGMELLRSALPRTIDVCERLAELPAPVMADRGQLLTVLMNLGSNAADAMEGATGVLEVTLAAETLANGSASLTLHPLPPGSYARLSVRDTGHGMDDQTMRRVFEPFFTTKGVGSGTGLGLATAQAIVAAHGGSIHVHSAPGQGATFDIYLPLTAAEGEEAASA